MAKKRKSKYSPQDAQQLFSDLNELFEDLKTEEKNSRAKDFFNFVANFPKLAPINAALVFLQRPGSRMVASAAQWKSNYGRKVKFGERPLLVLWPCWPIGFVFDFEQTEPINERSVKEIPEEFGRPLRATGQVPQGMLDTLLFNLRGQGILLKTTEMGAQMGGSIQILRDNSFQCHSGKCVKTIYGICLKKNHDETSLFATLLHELGHLFCGHFQWGILGKAFKDYRVPEREDLKDLPPGELRQIMEFEAESVSWLLTRRFGIESPSSLYLSSWLQGEKDIPPVNFDAIIKAVGRIEKLCLEIAKPYKPLLLKLDNMDKNERAKWRKVYSYWDEASQA